MDAIVPYLLFNGNADDAITFYAAALNGKIITKSTFGESPVPSSEEMKNKIMHASMEAGNLSIMVSDCPPDRASIPGDNVQLSLNFSDIASMDKTFAALSEGGMVKMELQYTFWGARFGMLTDKFGIHWMFNYDKEKKDK